MKKWNRAGIAVLFLVMLAVVTGCGKGEENATVVNMGYFNNITHAQALLMKSEGTLESSFGDGISVNWNAFNAGPAEVEVQRRAEQFSLRERIPVLTVWQICLEKWLPFHRSEIRSI